MSGLDEGLQMLRWDVFVVEGDDVDGLGEGFERRIVLIVADGHLIDDLCGGGVGGLCENGEADAEGFGGGGHHAGQLTAADDTDSRKSHVCHPNAGSQTRRSGICSSCSVVEPWWPMSASAEADSTSESTTAKPSVQMTRKSPIRG